MRSTLSIVVAVLAFETASPALAQERTRPPQGPPGTVTLPLAEYDRLVDRANNPTKRPDPPPMEAVISRGEFRVRVGAGVVRGTLRLEGEVFRTGAARIPLVNDATIFEARTDGRPLPVMREGNSHVAIVTGPAPFSASIDWGVALGVAPGRASFTLPASQAGSVSATIDLPGDPADIRVEPGLITQRQTAAGRTHVDVTLKPGEKSQVSWAMREAGPQTTPADARMLADVKSLWRIGEADVQLVALIEITMIRGEARSFGVHLPAGFEPSSITGSSLDTSDTKGDVLTLVVRDAGQRRHQFLISAERPHEAGPFKLEAPLLSVASAQRETGEVAIEGGGTIEVGASGDEALRRMDVREVHASLRSLSQEPLLAAFRYQRRPGETRKLALDVKRFPDAPVIAAVADHATVTSLLTTEGRMLTEITLRLRNRAQPFVKVTLPAGATMLSVDVAGESARPVQGSDGLRVPLLRPGFKTSGAYPVSFVYLQAGTPFEKRGDAYLTVAAVDLPISMLEWELFVPDGYSVKPTGGNVIPGAALVVVAAGLRTSGVVESVTIDEAKAPAKTEQEPQQTSQNVLNLQRRVAGVLPVRIDVPRTGTSHRYMRPLVLGEVTEVSLKYKRR